MMTNVPHNMDPMGFDDGFILSLGGVFPRCSMYGIFTYVYHKFKPNVGKYTIHGAYGFLFQCNIFRPGN